MALFSAVLSCAGAPQPPSNLSGARESTAEIAERLAKNPTGIHADADALALRADGPFALATLLGDTGPTPSEDQKRRIDEVAGQRDAYASQLYWYTDLEEAKRVARLSDKPILALRLLGKLTDELSCANSRFFRTTLYPNTKISEVLRDRFVLYWSMERPAPTITIDFHDGRKIERTVTGNSIHYVLDQDGRPIDAIPGLYSPDAFLEALDNAHVLFARLEQRGTNDRATIIREFHRERLADDRKQWDADFARAGLASQPFLVNEPPQPGAPDANPVAANLAMPIAITKMVVEQPMVKAIMPVAMADRAAIDATPWASLAAARRHSRLDDASRMLIRAKHPMDWSDPSAPHPLSDEALAQVLDGFETYMAEDTEKNEMSLHASIHAWLELEPEIDLATLNKRVYDTLFLTPRSDPWLGLVPPSTFTGIENDGVIPR